MLGTTARLEQQNTGFIVPASMLTLPVIKKVVTGNDVDVEQVNLWANPPPVSYAASLKEMIAPMPMIVGCISKRPVM